MHRHETQGPAAQAGARGDARREARLDAYLARLDAALAGLPTAGRREIVWELRSHLLEQMHRAPGRDVEAVLDELGAPEVYARQFLADDEAAAASPPAPPAPAGARGSVTLRGLVHLSACGWRGAPLLLASLVLYGVAGLALVFVLGEFVDPANTGVFVPGPHDVRRFVSVVVSGDRPPGRDVLGRALIPLGLGVVAAIHLGVRTLLRGVLRRAADDHG